MFIPYKKITISTQRSVDQILGSVNSNLQQPKFLGSGYKKNGLPFAGKTAESTFRIHRAIHHHNAWLPELYGEVKSDSDSMSSVLIRMKLNNLSFTLTGIWLIGTFLFGVTDILTGDFLDNPLLEFVGAFYLFILGYVFSTGLFQYEAKRAEELITKIIT